MTNPFINMEDKDLMLKYQAEDNLAFEVLYQRHSSKVYTYLSKRLHDKNEIDDLYQRVFVKFHKSRSLYDKKYDVLAWLYTITKSEFLDFIKKRKINYTLFDEKQHSELSSSLNENLNSIDIESENSLSKNEKKAITQRYINDKDYNEISEILETSNANVRKLISRGLLKLKNKYKGVKS